MASDDRSHAHAPDHPAHVALLHVMTASGVHRDDPRSCRVPEGYDVTIDGVTQRYRCRTVPRSLSIGQPLGVATRTSDLPWRWSVETSFDVGCRARQAPVLDARVLTLP